MSANGWTCFHCAEYFPATVEGRAAAREHFGASHGEGYRQLNEANQRADGLLAQLMDVAFEFARLRDEIDALLARANVEDILDAVEQLETLRSRLQAADVFSRSVHRLRPSVWSVAMVDAHGPGDHTPPADLVFPPGDSTARFFEVRLGVPADEAMGEAMRAFLKRRNGT